MLTQLEAGKDKWEATWPVVTVRVNGHAVQGRPETVAALTGAVSFAQVGEGRFVGTKAECEGKL
jgi:hypothetical protein